MKEIQLLVKLGEYQYMERLIKDGELHLCPMSYFSKIDSNNGVGDKYENAISYSSPKDPSIKLIFKDGKEFQLSKNTQITYGKRSCVDSLIYCMSMIDFVRNGDVLTIKNPDNLNKTGLGYDTMIIVLDTNEFIKRVENAIPDDWRITYKPVDYYPENNVVLKELSPFDKRESYSSQTEFRFCFSGCNIDESYSLKIGNIEDIAQIKQAKPIKQKP